MQCSGLKKEKTSNWIELKKLALKPINRKIGRPGNSLEWQLGPIFLQCISRVPTLTSVHFLKKIINCAYRGKIRPKLLWKRRHFLLAFDKSRCFSSNFPTLLRFVDRLYRLLTANWLLLSRVLLSWVLLRRRVRRRRRRRFTVDSPQIGKAALLLKSSFWAHTACYRSW